MDTVVSVILVVTAIVHFLPVFGVGGEKQLQTLYGITLSDPNLVVMMRHRAVLFGLIGVFLLYSAFQPDLFKVGLGAGIVSVSAFIWLFLTAPECNSHMRKVAIIDAVVLIGLIVGSLLMWVA